MHYWTRGENQIDRNRLHENPTLSKARATTLFMLPRRARRISPAGLYVTRLFVGVGEAMFGELFFLSELCFPPYAFWLPAPM